ncbi:caspase family protein [Nocardia noduli]|uniref:caspase family protein n=1 Tax=Nocardia noduli TaxID=2815722 RepID=UPI001C216EA4|nr:caspase family protein [Nocardia noduli]
MTRRPDADRSRAVLIGVSRYETGEPSSSDPSEELPPLESVSSNLADLRQLLTEPDLGTFNQQHCVVVENPQRASGIGGVVSAAARDAEDVLLVYYSGHGLVDSRGRLYLGLPGSSPTQAPWTSLSFETLREALLDSPARLRILILDCCFSGRAFEAMGVTDTLQDSQFDIQGTYTLTSSAANEPSFAPAGEKHTAFTGALLDIARQSPGLTLEDLYRATQRHLAAQGRPEPRRRSVNVAGDLVIFGHPSHSASARTTEIEQQPERTYEFDEARRVTSHVAPNPAVPQGFWDVTIRNGSATPMAGLEVEVYPVDNDGTRTEGECVTAKGHPMLWKVYSEGARAQVRKKVSAFDHYGANPFAQFSIAGAMEDRIMSIVDPIASSAMAQMEDFFSDSLPAGEEETVLYYAPDAATVRADLTFTDISGRRWTRSHDQLPRPLRG